MYIFYVFHGDTFTEIAADTWQEAAKTFADWYPELSAMYIINTWMFAREEEDYA